MKAFAIQFVKITSGQQKSLLLLYMQLAFKFVMRTKASRGNSRDF